LNTEPKLQSEFKIQLDQYTGPADLLLYLVRRNELSVDEIPVSVIARQYCEFLEVIEVIDINLVGDFLEIAGLLVESKLRAILPRNELLDDVKEQRDPRENLVHRLLMYKQFKDAAELLAEQGRQWQDRFVRVRDDLPPRRVDPAEQPIHEVELWDLVSAFGRVLKRQQTPPTEDIVYDETPITVYMQRIHNRILREQHVTFSSLFEPGMHKSALVGVFLAVLELVRHHNALTDQSDDHGEIVIGRGEGFSDVLDIGDEITFT